MEYLTLDKLEGKTATLAGRTWTLEGPKTEGWYVAENGDAVQVAHSRQAVTTFNSGGGEVVITKHAGSRYLQDGSANKFTPDELRAFIAARNNR